MPDPPNTERDALSRITGAYRRLQDKRASAQGAQPAPAQGAQPPPAARPVPPPAGKR